MPTGGQQELIITTGYYEDGSLGEVFIDLPYQQAKYATALLGKDAATLISIALQHGATVHELRAATGRSEVNHMGMMVEMPHTIIGTVLDALASETPAAPTKETP